ncbi:MAG: methylenetetrahydrofolate reductase [NAD(P)H] [Planctomycetes bacterium]|nr:methylenetetrahydrofolate reductase [NAD(P)H] [Planctomycetota bacterium]
MDLATCYGTRPGISFELFPPKTPAGDAVLFEHLDRLMSHRPAFITCTYGAGGSTRDRTLELIARVKTAYRLTVASHLTCVGASVDELRAYLTRARERGIDAIVALRGDPPAGQASFEPAPGGFRNARELVGLIRAEFPEYGIAVAGYPETHREAPSARADLENLKRKVDTGADIVMTQLFYDNGDFFRFADACASIGIQVPLIPGILPITNLAQIQRISSLCGARLPASLVNRLALRDDPDWQFQVGVEFAVGQVRELLARGVPGIHFYVLNKSQAACEVLDGALA